MYPVIGRGWPETLSIRFISALFSPLLSLLLAFKWKRVYPFASFIFIISSPTCSLDIWCRQKQKKNPPTLGGEKKLYSRRHKIKMSDSKTPPRIHHAANCAFSLIKHFFFFFLSINDAWKRSKQTNVLFRFRNQCHTHRVPEIFSCTLLSALRNCFAANGKEKYDRERYIDDKDRISKFLV